jgi:excisionase family DNA binding protein
MLKVREAARRLGCDPKTVRRWIRSGRLKSEKIGNQHFVSEADVEALASSEVELGLPAAWKTTDSGAPMPPWERLVRNARRNH